MTGGTRIDFLATGFGGAKVTPSAMAETKTIVLRRLAALHVTGAQVSIVGAHFSVEVPSTTATIALGAVSEVGVLRFRRALELAAGPGTALSGSSETQPGRLAPLPGSEAPTLTDRLEESFAAWNCAKNPNPTEGVDRPDDYIIACATDGSYKYLLAPAAVEGTQVSSAAAGLDPENHWSVMLIFNGAGSAAWQQLTKQAYDVNNGMPAQSCSPPRGCNAVAIVLDGTVLSAPYSETAGGILGGNAQISGGFTQASADALAGELMFGALPVRLAAPDVVTTTN